MKRMLSIVALIFSAQLAFGASAIETATNPRDMPLREESPDPVLRDHSEDNGIFLTDDGLTPADVFKQVMEVVPQRLQQEGNDHPSTIAELIDDIRDDDIHYLDDHSYVRDLLLQGPQIKVLEQMSEEERNAALVARNLQMVQTLLDRYDSNKDQRLSLAELGEVTFELMPIAQRGGGLTRRTLVMSHLTGLRYFDFDGDGHLSYFEEAMQWTLYNCLRRSNGNLNAIWEELDPYVESVRHLLSAEMP